MTEQEPQISSRPVWQRCWCWQTGRCLTDCPTAHLPKPVPFTDANWRQKYEEAMAARG